MTAYPTGATTRAGETSAAAGPPGPGAVSQSASAWHRFAAPGEPVTLSPLLTAGEDWPTHRAEILRRWHDTLGAPARSAVSPLTLRWADEATGDGYRRHEVSYSGACGDTVPAYLLVPEVATPRGLRAVLALHQTTVAGRREPAGIAGDPQLRYAHELARRGYVVLAPDEFMAGDRVVSGQEFRSAGFEREHPDWSGIGRMLADHECAVTVLSGSEMVDPYRIGVIGHSLGGLNAWWLLGADPRVRAAVVSCGYGTFAGDPNPLRWVTEGRFRYLHRLEAALRRREAPFEHHEILALCAPRPLLLWATRQDEVFPHWEQTVASVVAVREVYHRYGVADHLELALADGPHAFPRAAREQAYRFLDRHLT